MRSCLTVFLTLSVLSAFASPALAADLRYFDDATLRSVQFVDGSEGWAVGDEGVVWHTIDGGKSWDRQPTGVRASLRSVHFILPFRGVGWIAGREELQGGGSVGVILFTNDAGITWQRLLPNSMPGLNQVRFLDQKTGFLLGDGSEQFSSGVFKTTDGGRTWEPVKGPRTSTWFAGDFQDAQTGIVAGAWSKLAHFRPSPLPLSPEGERGRGEVVFSTAQVDKLDGRSIFGLHVIDGKTPFVLAVGQGGLILFSKAGNNWGFVNPKLPRDVLPNLDFHAIHSVGQKIWIAGRPGSVVLTSDDQGDTWRLQKTGQNMPLNAIYFFDAKHGWAVGEGGTILGTVDGGQAWTVQRQGGQRAALLFVHALPEQMPVDTLARLGADEGYLAVGLRCIAPDAESSAWVQSLAAQRFTAGTRQAGGMTGETLWQFPLPQYLLRSDKQAILDHWNRLHAGEAERQFLRQLVLAVRMWRPSVVVGDAPFPQLSGSPAASLISEALQTALVQASDPQVFPEQIEQLGLLPWRASRYYAGWEKRNSQITYNASDIGTDVRLEASYRDFAVPAARILTMTEPQLPRERHYRLLACAPNETPGQRFLLENVPITEGEARRKIPLSPGSGEGDKLLRQAADIRRNLVTLADQPAAQAAGQPGKILSLIGPMLSKLPDEQGAAAAFDVASSYARQGQWLMARETFLLMVEKYPAQPLSAEAYRWLIRHASSSEARRRRELGQFTPTTTFEARKFTPSKPGEPSNPTGIAQASLTMLSNPNEARQWYSGGLEIGKRLAAFGPLYDSDPSIQFSLQSLHRQLGEFEQSNEWCSKFVQYYPRGPWHDAAATELWLAGRRDGSQAKQVAECTLTRQKPFLDGDMDDPCWQKAKPLELKNAVGDTAKQCPTKAWLAHDENFLYIFLRCEHPREMQVPTVKNRGRGTNLDAFDRVSILLDLDRDYSTCFQLQVDQRGCVREDCWGDPTWNPEWFVVVKSTPTAWHLEAAVPLKQLTSDGITANTAWACNIVRILPGHGVQAWSLPADVQPRPEGMGILLFRGN